MNFLRVFSLFLQLAFTLYYFTSYLGRILPDAMLQYLCIALVNILTNMEKNHCAYDFLPDWVTVSINKLYVNHFSYTVLEFPLQQNKNEFDNSEF